MPHATNAFFRTWLNSNNTIKISSNAAVVRITYDGIVNFVSLADFDQKSIESLPTTCKDKIPAFTDDTASGITAEPAVTGYNIYFIVFHRLIVGFQAAKYYNSIGRTMNATYMHYGIVLLISKIEWDAYEELKKFNYPNVSLINDTEIIVK